MKYVFYALLLYILYNFIFKVIIPGYFATQKVKKGFKQMQEEMQQKMKQQQDAFQTKEQQTQTPPPKHKAGDYIDFEDVK